MPTTIYLVEPDSNRRGDLFTRRVADVLHVLGWQDFRFDVAKSGRELDVTAKHRVESRHLRAECKATKSTTGGSDLNKFAGAVQVERATTDSEVVAYYLSLSGYSETAIEQELQADRGIVLFTSADIVRELTKANIIVEGDYARRAASDASTLPAHASQEDDTVLLAHELGWIWVVFSAVDHERRYFTFVHADGDGISESIAQSIIADDSEANGLLTNLTYAPLPSRAIENPSEAVYEYRKYLLREFGYLTLEGMPADERMGSRAIPLGDLYVPMAVHNESKGTDVTEEGTASTDLSFEIARTKLTDVLQGHDHVALVGPPGCGKSTIIKWLATQDALVASRGEGPTNSGPTPFPIVVRCRSLGETASRPLTEIIQDVIYAAELGAVAADFTTAVSNSLRDGSLILLIDGLDEIANSTERAAFASQLRTFLGTYPSIKLVATSRSSAFRTIANSLRVTCQVARVADLTNEDIHSLCHKWQAQVLTGEANDNSLAKEIISNARVRALAVNPLLLTTMLLVKRWLGELPRKRSVLYGKAIEVLAMTWNVEAHEPLDLDEALPQLGYLAYQMLTTGQQVVARTELQSILSASRRDMPELLGYTNISPGAFIEAVESRSSLLSVTGHSVVGGMLQPHYEFKHLAFQEYLAAQAIVEGWHPERSRNRTFPDTLIPHIGDESWEEVIPLVGSLAGRRASALITLLLDHTDDADDADDDVEDGTINVETKVLLSCLQDEVQISPELARRSCHTVIRHLDMDADWAFVLLLDTKFRDIFLEVALAGAERIDVHATNYCMALRSRILASHATDARWISQADGGVAWAAAHIEGSERLNRIEALLIAMEAGWHASGNFDLFLSEGDDGDLELDLESIRDLGTRLRSALLGDSFQTPLEQYCAYWALAWFNPMLDWTLELTREFMARAASVWSNSTTAELHRMVGWSTRLVPLAHISSKLIRLSDSQEVALRQSMTYAGPFAVDYVVGAFTLLYCSGSNLADDELPEAAHETFSAPALISWLKQMVEIADPELPKATLASCLAEAEKRKRALGDDATRFVLTEDDDDQHRE